MGSPGIIALYCDMRISVPYKVRLSPLEALARRAELACIFPQSLTVADDRGVHFLRVTLGATLENKNAVIWNILHTVMNIL